MNSGIILDLLLLFSVFISMVTSGSPVGRNSEAYCAGFIEVSAV
jgi:hypothetical protein